MVNSGNARVINYTGVVCWQPNKLKEELEGRPDDALISKLDGIIEAAATGEGENRLVRLKDDEYQENGGAHAGTLGRDEAGNPEGVGRARTAKSFII